MYKKSKTGGAVFSRANSPGVHSNGEHVLNMIDLTNKKVGRLSVLNQHGAQGKQLTWLCRCDCGNTVVVRGDHLREGTTRSCGCLGKENRENGANFKHGGRKTRLYSIWAGMRKRCTNKNCTAYGNYGGRGIKVCKEWKDFSVFRDWALKSGYLDSLSIDRINVDGNYEPANCRWATAKMQANNRRKRR